MKSKKNRILRTLTILLIVIGIFWCVYSYFCFGLVIRYDLYGIPYTPILKKTMWQSFVIATEFNASLLLLSSFMIPSMKRKDIRRILYLVAISVNTLFVLFWEYNYMKLLIEFPEHRNQLSTYLRGGYYTYAIGTIIIYVLLLWLNKARRKMMNVHNLDIAESENPSE